MEDSSEADLDKQIGTLQEILNLKIDQVRNLVQGKDDSYIGRLMLETNKEILDESYSSQRMHGLKIYMQRIMMIFQELYKKK